MDLRLAGDKDAEVADVLVVVGKLRNKVLVVDIFRRDGPPQEQARTLQP